MNKKSSIIGILVFTGAVFTSCSLKYRTEPAAVISTDKTEITVGADAVVTCDPFSEQAPAVVDTLRITSSRSWSAVLKTDDGSGWVTLSAKEHINSGGAVETSDLLLSFSRYKGTEDRTATLTVCCAEYETPVVIPVTQKAYIPQLLLEAVGNPVGIPYDGGECVVIVRCNTEWKASISAEESTVIPTMSALDGEDTQTIRLEFPANSDDEQAKFATMVVTADGCEPCEMEFVQTQSDRFFYVSQPVPSEIEPYQSTIYIPLRSNGPWSAEVSECTFENGRVEPSEGIYSYSGVYFNYSMHGEDPLVGDKHALVTFRREGMPDVVVEFRQKGSIHLNFGHYNPEYEWDGQMKDDETTYKPYTSVTKVFSEPESFPYSYTNGTYGGIVTDCITGAGGFTFTMYGSDCGLYYVPGSYCFCIGKKQGDYVAFPAFEGYRLSEMYYEASCRNITPYTVRDADGNIISGGEQTVTVQTIPISQEYNDMHHHVFPDTKPGVSYRMVLEETLRVISIKDLCLVYERYE